MGRRNGEGATVKGAGMRLHNVNMYMNRTREKRRKGKRNDQEKYWYKERKGESYWPRIGLHEWRCSIQAAGNFSESSFERTHCSGESCWNLVEIWRINFCNRISMVQSDASEDNSLNKKLWLLDKKGRSQLSGLNRISNEAGTDSVMLH